MNLILLPGNHPKSKPWLRTVEQTLADQFEETYCHDYAHWEEEQPDIDLSREVGRIAELSATRDPYFVFAKSAGTILTLKAINEGVLKPKACLLAGVPLLMAKSQELPLTQWLKDIHMPTVILQNEHDPFGSHTEIQNIVSASQNIHLDLVELPGSTHDYDDHHVIRASMQALHA